VGKGKGGEELSFSSGSAANGRVIWLVFFKKKENASVSLARPAKTALSTAKVAYRVGDSGEGKKGPKWKTVSGSVLRRRIETKRGDRARPLPSTKKKGEGGQWPKSTLALKENKEPPPIKTGLSFERDPHGSLVAIGEEGKEEEKKHKSRRTIGH